MSPFTTIPRELAGHIFEECTWNCTDAPLVLGSVCKEWRLICAANPRMWCRIRIASNEHRKAAYWLKRSGVCPLDVCVDLRAGDVPDTSATVHVNGEESIHTEGETPAASGLPLVLSTQMHRVRMLVLRAPSEQHQRNFLAAMYQNVGPTSSNSMLQTIKLHVTTGDSTSPPTVHTRQPQELQNLYHTTYGTSVILRNLAQPSSWVRVTGITSLSLLKPLRSAPLAIETILDLLEASPALQMVEIMGRIREHPGEVRPLAGGDDLHVNTDPRTVLLPNLRHLKITANNVHDVLGGIVAPQLQFLHLVDLDGRTPWTGRALKQLLSARRDGEHSIITSLRLECVVAVAPETVDWCLRRLPALEKLVLERCYLADSVMKSLCAGNGEVCPRLSFLAFATCRKVDLPAIACVALARGAINMCVLDDSDAGLCERGCLPRAEMLEVARSRGKDVVPDASPSPSGQQ